MSDLSNFNYMFQLGNIKSVPDGDYVYNIHKWSYDKLETHHGYIQWLFPIPRSKGMNFYSYELTLPQAIIISKNKKCRSNILKSYKTMLSFYGIRLTNLETGELQTTDNWKERYENLLRHSHNNLRITRIIISMSCLGFLEYSIKFIEFLYKQIYITKNIWRCKGSYDNYWKNELYNYKGFYINVKQMSCGSTVYQDMVNEVTTIKESVIDVNNVILNLYKSLYPQNLTG
eukprot:TRINITY_DN8555_c0_g1_i1.p1 TRINITY_DN8555_c0_g1~~TRINITY_DN8555_c0_g1_i1.p1  ORF type:complete len:230 (+),score=13.14 TRINITY_DN8555_c0_g1_i1:45-734(+)